MLRKLLPFVLALAGLAVGLGAGMALRAPTAEVTAETKSDTTKEGQSTDPPTPNPASEPTTKAVDIHGGSDADGRNTVQDDPEHPVEYVRFNNQFVIPIVERGQVAAMVVLALSLEVSRGQTERVYQLEPKLRDALLQVMFDHANSGGFSGDFTDGAALEPLRRALREAAIRTFGPEVKDVLISDIMRQDS